MAPSSRHGLFPIAFRLYDKGELVVIHPQGKGSKFVL